MEAIENSNAESVLLFAKSVAQAQHLAAGLYLAGFPARAVSGRTDGLVRQHFNLRFGPDDVRVISNQGLVTTELYALKADMVLISRPVFRPVLDVHVPRQHSRDI